MHFNCVFKHNRAFDRQHSSLPVLCWISGLLVGVIFALWHRASCFTLLEDAVLVPASPFICVIAAAVPLTAIGLCLVTGRFPILYFFLFLYGLFHGFSGSFVSCLFPDGAWLVRILVLFSAGCTSALIWFLLVRSFQRGGSLFSTDILTVAVLFTLTSLLNLLFISPVLSVLTDYFIL